MRVIYLTDKRRLGGAIWLLSRVRRKGDANGDFRRTMKARWAKRYSDETAAAEEARKISEDSARYRATVGTL